MHSLIIARLLGPLMLVSAAAVLFNRKAVQEVVEDTAKSPALVYLSGVITLVSGLAIIENHNVWVAGWQVLITLFGWMAILGGIARMIFPKKVAELSKQMAQNDAALLISTSISALIGAIFTINGLAFYQ